MSTTHPVADHNLDGYGTPPIEWQRVLAELEGGFTQAPDTGGPNRHTTWLATTNPDGTPHVMPVGSGWVDGGFWFTSGPGTRKSRNLADNPACVITVSTHQFDLVAEGSAARVTDEARLQKMAAICREDGWPASVEGDAFTAEFSAPSAGPPPWYLYHMDADTPLRARHRRAVRRHPLRPLIERRDRDATRSSRRCHVERAKRSYSPAPMRRAGRLSVSVLVALAAFGAIIIHRRLPWVPLAYLLALIVLPLAGWRIARLRTAPRPLRWSLSTVAALSVVALCPVPWLKADLDHPPGSAWQLDGRLEINGMRIDPPGTWYWLTVGRPPIVAELVKGWLFDDTGAPVSMRQGRLTQRPAFSEPAAAAIGLRRAGWPVEMTTVIEVSDPLAERLPERAVLAALNGFTVTTRDEWDAAVHGLGAINTITTTSGASFAFDGATIPFGRVDVIEVPRDGLRAVVGGRLARTLPGRGTATSRSVRRTG